MATFLERPGIDKFGNCMRLCKPVLLLLILGPSFENCVIKRGYELYLVVDKDCNVGVQSKVIFEGKEVGLVKETTLMGANKLLLKLFINDGISVPKESEVRCRENMLGDVYVDIQSKARGLPMKSTYFQNEDTLYGGYTSRYKKLDSTAKKQIFQKLDELKNIVDSVAKENDSPLSK